MNMKTLSLATGLVIAISSAAFAQGVSTGGNSGSGTPRQCGSDQ